MKVCVNCIDQCFVFSVFSIEMFGGVVWDDDEKEIYMKRTTLMSVRVRDTSCVCLLFVLDYTTAVKNGNASKQWATSACISYYILTELMTNRVRRSGQM